MPWLGSPPGTRPTPGCGWRSSAGWRSRLRRFIPLCDRIAPSEGRSELLSQAAAIVGVRRRFGRAGRAARHDRRIAVHRRDRTVDRRMTLLAGLADGLERSGHAAPCPDRRPAGRSEGDCSNASPRSGRPHRRLAASGRPLPERLVALDVLARGRPDLAEAIIPGLLATDQPRDGPVGRRAGRRPGRLDFAGRQSARPLGIDWPWPRAASCSRPWPARRRWPNRSSRPSSDRSSRRASSMPRPARASSTWPIPPCGIAPRPCWRSSRRRSRSAVIARYQIRAQAGGRRRPRRGRLRQELPDLPPAPGTGTPRRAGPLGHRRPRPRRDPLTDILDPNRNVEPDYVVLAAATRRGQVSPDCSPRRPPPP